MEFLVSAKGSDVLAWRASGEFAARYRQSLLAQLEFCRANEAEVLLTGTGQALEEMVAANDGFRLYSTDLIGEVVTCAEPARLRELITEFYAGLYDHIAVYHSAPAFYELSSQLLQALSRSIHRMARTSLGLPEQHTVPVILIALGASGRQEFSPFTPLQLMLVHAEADDAEQETIAQLGRLIHEGFEACGLLVDGIVTPRNQEWRGSMSHWRQRLTKRLEQGSMNQLDDLFMLADQSILCQDEGFGVEFTELCRFALRECRSAMAPQVTRVVNLSHGLGLMGGIRFEKKGPFRGMFALRDNALQPLSAAICVLAILKGLETSSTPQRIREILWKHELNVDMAERLLQAWHTLHELRLNREREMHADRVNEASLYLNVGDLHDSEQNHLRESLETVGAIQRHVGQIFSGMVE